MIVTERGLKAILKSGEDQVTNCDAQFISQKGHGMVLRVHPDICKS
jgi:hypothetical protein